MQRRQFISDGQITTQIKSKSQIIRKNDLNENLKSKKSNHK